jgi:hypothetical protein
MPELSMAISTVISVSAVFRVIVALRMGPPLMLGRSILRLGPQAKREGHDHPGGSPHICLV